LSDEGPLIEEAADQLRLVQRRLLPGETIWLTVRSGSMVPWMPVGARIEVAAVAGSRCEVGDVFVFERRGRLVAHRLLMGWGSGPLALFLQRGDGVSPAGLVRADAILGRVVAVRMPEGDPVRMDGREDAWRARLAARRSLRRLLRSLLPGSS
jgi:hypothetical protein